MAFIHGSNSKVYVTTIDLSAYFNNAEFQTTADVSETTAFGKSAKTYKAGLREGTATLSGFWDGGTDASDEELQGALGSSTNKVVALGIDGVDTGDKVKFFDGFATNYGISSPVGDIVAVSADFVADDGMYNGDVLYNGAFTATGAVGSALDNSASSDGGVGAFLICTSVSGTSPTADIKIQHSADNVTYVDLITFTQVTAATSEFKTVASGTTINRYIKLYNTIGGSSTPTINAFVGFARLG